MRLLTALDGLLLPWCFEAHICQNRKKSALVSSKRFSRPHAAVVKEKPSFFTHFALLDWPLAAPRPTARRSDKGVVRIDLTLSRAGSTSNLIRDDRITSLIVTRKFETCESFSPVKNKLSSPRQCSVVYCNADLRLLNFFVYPGLWGTWLAWSLVYCWVTYFRNVRMTVLVSSGNDTQC